MGALTIELDDETEMAVRREATLAGLSVEQWIVSKLPKRKPAKGWPKAFLETLGALQDFPSPEELRADLREDGEGEPP